MTRPLLLLSALLLVAAHLHALEGRVVRGENAPVAGVVVSIAGEGRSVRTGADGRFSIDPEPRYPARVVVTSADGTTRVIDFAEPPDASVEILLGEVVAEMITVSSASTPHIEAPPGAATDTLSSDELATLAPVHVADAVLSIPGVAASDGGPSSVPSVRGLARGRTLLLLDDARIATERRAGSSASFVNPFTLAAVEVARGPGSVAYGSDALGGVIHLRTREPSPGDPAIRFESGTLFGGEETDSLGAEVTVDASATSFLASAYGRRGADGEDGDGNSIENSSFRDHGLALRASRIGDFGMLTAGVGFDRGRDLERPAPPGDPARTSYPIEDSDRLSASLDLPGAAGWSAIRLNGSASRYRQTLDRSTPRAGGGSSVSSSDNESWDAALRAGAERPLGSGRFEAGIDASARLGLESLLEDRVVATDGTVLDSSTSVAIESADRIDGGLFVLVEQPLSARSWLSAGVRADTISSKNQGGWFGDRSDRDSAISGHAAFSSRIGDSALATLQVARGFRAPTLSDRYYRGPTGRGFVTGNPLLEPETSLQFDASARWQRGASSLAVFAYLYRIDDLIERYRAGDDFAFRNRGEAEIRGLEIEAEAPISQHLSARVSGAYARGESRDAGEEPLDDIAPPNARAELRWRRGATAMSGSLSWFKDDTRPGPSEIEREGWLSLDLSFSRQLTGSLELRLNAANLTDETRYASSDAISALSPGRTLGITLAGRFAR
ncbi:MAG: TonB-dependent receptor [Thermoanaerobaculia bacterium]|nr:TonB-dependent receptor [Thermoanaerobaculia bacterium]